VRSTSTPYVVLLNNDTVVLSEDWIECLLELCQQPDIGVVGCMLVHADGRLQHAGIGIGYGTWPTTSVWGGRCSAMPAP